jgi:DnaK suppressor protein
MYLSAEVIQCGHMDHLSPAEREELRGQLTAEQARVLARAGTGSGAGLSPENVRLEIDDAEPADIQDRAREERDRSVKLAMTRVDRRRLDELDAALARMEDGTYGLCEETDDPIPLGRLRAQPTARYTVEAQELVEAEAEHADEPDEPAAY